MTINHTSTVNGIATTYRLYHARSSDLLFRLKAPEIGTTVHLHQIHISSISLLYDNTTRTTMRAIFRTGGDDLRGGDNDNLNLIFILKNTDRVVRFSNVNNKRPWGNNSEKQVSNDFPQDVSIDDIAAIKLEHTGGNGMGADNWDLAQLTVYLAVGGREQLLFTQSGSPPLPLQRFTGDYRQKTFTIDRR